MIKGSDSIESILSSIIKSDSLENLGIDITNEIFQYNLRKYLGSQLYLMSRGVYLGNVDRNYFNGNFLRQNNTNENKFYGFIIDSNIIHPNDGRNGSNKIQARILTEIAKDVELEVFWEKDNRAKVLRRHTKVLFESTMKPYPDDFSVLNTYLLKKLLKLSKKSPEKYEHVKTYLIARMNSKQERNSHLNCGKPEVFCELEY